MLLAAAETTGLVKRLKDIEPTGEGSPSRLVNSNPTSREQLWLTLLFMNVFAVRRPWDLRSYSGDGLALLSGRQRAYGYVHTERFLAAVAQAGTAEPLTDKLAEWTHQLWSTPSMTYYIDGHKKAVYSDQLLPRGLVGRLGKILSCRALTVLMDAQGHPRLVLTARGDQHLTLGLPAIVERYERVVGQGTLAQIIVDREGMSAAFLKDLSTERTLITLLRADQYTGVESFSAVGDFTPLALDPQGQVLREVAAAQFTLTLPDQPTETLRLAVALIRDWRKLVPVSTTAETDPRRWDADLSWDVRGQWLDGQFEATPAPTQPMQPQLIPIVSTADTFTPVELVALYGQRWTAQENILRDFLLPLGLDTNHGYMKTPVENSEIAKRREILQNRLDNARAWAVTAYRKQAWNAKRGDKLRQEANAYADAQYRQLNLRLSALEYQLLPQAEWRALVKRETALIDPEIDRRRQQVNRTLQRAHQEWDKYERYCRLQRQTLRELAALEAQGRTMYELDNAKDHLMSVLKFFLVNLIMWLRDHCFPATYTHATLTRLLPFFRLPGHVLTLEDRVVVTLRPFNDRALNRDLAAFCHGVNQAHLCLPTGKILAFRIAQAAVPTLNVPP